MDINQPLPGVAVGLWMNVQGTLTQLPVNEQGRVEFDLAEGDCLLLRVTHSSSTIHAFNVDGSKNAQLATNFSSQSTYTDNRRRVHIKRSQKDTRVLHTEYPENNLRLIEITDDGTRFRTYEISLVSQPDKSQRGKVTNRFYLGFQQVYEAGLYQDEDGYLACPRFQEQPNDKKNWHQLVEIVENLVDIAALPALSTYQPEAALLDLTDVPDGAAVVEWFNVANGTGCLHVKGEVTVGQRTLTDPMVFVHWSEAPLHPDQERRYLTRGETVGVGAFELTRPTKGRPSEFVFQAVATHLLREVALVG